jgi:hypothetical protein
MKRVPVFLISIALTGLVILAGCAASAPGTGNGPALSAESARPTVSPAVSLNPAGSPSAAAPRDPVDAIREFTGNQTAAITLASNLTAYDGRRIDIYRMGGDNFYVDGNTGTVMGASFSLPPLRTGPYTNATAEPVARAFAEKHYPGFATRNMVARSETLDHGDGGIEYTYTWTEMEDGVDVGNLVEVSVNPDGQVLSYHAYDDPVPHFEPARISKETANATAVDFVISRGSIKNVTEIRSWSQLALNPLNRSEVTWVVDMMVVFRDPGYPGGSDYRGGLVTIDGVNGTVINYNPLL